MKLIKSSTTIALLLTSGSILAGNIAVTDTNALIPNAVSAEVGSFGYGGNVTWYANDTVDLQVGYNGGNIISDVDVDVEELTFTGETDFSSPYIGLQLRPMQNWFTVGTGVIYTDGNSITATAKPKANVEFEYNGKKYKADSTDAQIDTSIELENTLSPYLTIGFHPKMNNKFGVFGDIGLAYTGGLNTDVKARGSFTKDGSSTALTQSQIEELESDARKEIEDTLSGNDRFYPVLKLGATYNF